MKESVQNDDVFVIKSNFENERGGGGGGGLGFNSIRATAQRYLIVCIEYNESQQPLHVFQKRF